jgi:hypothetical protein
MTVPLITGINYYVSCLMSYLELNKQGTAAYSSIIAEKDIPYNSVKLNSLFSLIYCVNIQ